MPRGLGPSFRPKRKPFWPSPHGHAHSNPIGLAEFLASGCTLGPRSLFRDIEVLEPGMMVTFDRAGVRRRRLFKAEDLEGLAPVDGTQFLEGFAESLRAAVDRSVTSSPAVAVSLTGGLDSRMLMASLDKPPGSVPCYTFGTCIAPPVT